MTSTLDSIRPVAARDNRIFWLLWAAAAGISWLLPTHSAPWTTYYQELAAALISVAVGLWILLRFRLWQVDALAAGFISAALVPLAQALAGLFKFPAEAPLASAYLVGIALTMLVARHAEKVAPGRLIDALFAGLAIASLLSTGMALHQWLSLDTLGPLLAPMPLDDRPVANVGQPNNLATLLGWGLVSIWWAHANRNISGPTAVVTAAFLLIGMTLTQSRAGFLEVALLGGVAFFARRTLRTGPQAKAFMGLAAWFGICILALEPLTALLTDQISRSLFNPDSPRERTMLLRMVLSAIGERPWFGWGWNQNVIAHVALAAQFPMHGTVANAHNLVLDLIVWNGLPIGLLLTLGLLAWLTQAVRRATTPRQFLVLAGIGVFGVHTMLELPHVLAYFLMPAAIMMGTINAWAPLPTLATLPRWTVAVLVIAAGAALIVEFDDYTRIERNGIDVAMLNARLGPPRVVADVDVHLLTALQSALSTLRSAPRRDMTSAQLAQLRKTVMRYPTTAGLFRFAEASALNHRVADARWALATLCELHPPADCKAAARDWRTLAVNAHPEMTVVDVPDDHTLSPSERGD